MSTSWVLVPSKGTFRPGRAYFLFATKYTFEHSRSCRPWSDTTVAIQVRKQPRYKAPAHGSTITIFNNHRKVGSEMFCAGQWYSPAPDTSWKLLEQNIAAGEEEEVCNIPNFDSNHSDTFFSVLVFLQSRHTQIPKKHHINTVSTSHISHTHITFTRNAADHNITQSVLTRGHLSQSIVCAGKMLSITILPPSKKSTQRKIIVVMWLPKFSTIVCLVRDGFSPIYAAESSVLLPFQACHSCPQVPL